MLQRGLAILLSVCMLAGGTGDTAYAMNPQSNAGTVSAVQNVSDTGEISEFSTEDAISDPAAEDGEKPQEDQTGNGDSSGNSGDGMEGDAAGSETSDDGNIGNDDGTTGDAADSGDSATGESDGSEGDAGHNGMETDENITENEDGNDSDAAVNEDEANTGEIAESEAEDIVDDSEADVSVQSIREEVLTLTTSAPQEVTLAEEEKQWLCFTAPQEGLFRFYSTAESSSYQTKNVYLFHEKTDDLYAYFFGQDGGNGQNGNFSYTYRMQAGETVYLLVEFGSSGVGGTFTVNAEKVEAPELTVTKNSEGSYTLQSDSYRLNLVLTPFYSTVTAAMELQQANGSALTGGSSYRVYYKYSYDAAWGGKNVDEMTTYFYSFNGYDVGVE